MALTTLTPVAQWDDVKVPNNGTKMVAVSATDPPPNDEGPVRQAFQQLVNRTKWIRDKILDGTRSFKGLVIDGAGDQTVAPTAGSLSVSGGAIFGGSIGAVGPVSVTAGTDLTTIYPGATVWTGTTAVANPARTASVANKSLALNQAKVAGYIEVTDAVITASDGFGWTALNSSGTSLVVIFSTAFANALYTINLHIENGAFVPFVPVYSARTTAGFAFYCTNLAGVDQDVRIGSWKISFTVFGRVVT